jgi:hypothetical protein
MSNLGLWKIAVDTANLADGSSLAAYLTSSSGALLDSVSIGGNDSLYVKSASEHAEDTAHTSGDYGSLSLVVRSDAGGSLVSADGDYSPLQVDSSGRLRVLADLTASFDFTYAEDSAHADGDVGAFVLAVRQDTLASSTSADGDYGSFKQTSLGELYVADSAARTSLASILSELQGLTHAEDAAHVSGDLGVMSLAVRNDAGTALAADGDYIPLSTDANGNLRVSGTITIGGQYAEDSAAVSGDLGLSVLTVRKDALSTNVSADGDYGNFLAWSEGSLKVVDIPNIAMLATAESVTSTAAQLVATPLANRRSLVIQNRGDKSIFIGDSAVTTATGIEVPKGGSYDLTAGPVVDIWAVTASGTADVRVLEVS